ncbi:hypothetical protein HK102_010316, partial [Quaeritorhiza haematococci]
SDAGGVSEGTSTNAKDGSEVEAGLKVFDESTTQKAWSTILLETENIAKDRLTFSESLSNDVSDKLKSLALKKEEARKKHITFAQRILAEREKVYAEKEKAKQKYYESCDVVEMTKMKHDRAPDEKSQGKLKRQWHQEILDMNNNKNIYILSLASSNAWKQKYFRHDIPSLLSAMNDLTSSTALGLKKIWSFALELEKGLMGSGQDRLESIHDGVAGVDGVEDVKVYQARYNLGRGQGMGVNVGGREPVDFEFEASGLWRESGDMPTNDFAKIFLLNKLIKLRKRLHQLEDEIGTKMKGIEGMKNLVEAYSKNPGQGDADDVSEVGWIAVHSNVRLEGKFGNNC